MNYFCPVCAYPDLPYPPQDYHICPCCGTEFGNDDADLTHEQLREIWIAAGPNWFFGNPPPHWNPYLQLSAVGLASMTPRFYSSFFLEANPTASATKEQVHYERQTVQKVPSIAAAA